jgi:TM2 domain-containing membrane protein YozV
MNEEQKRRIIEEEKLRQSMQGKSVGVAIALSFLIPGLGDLYCRSWVKAGIFAVLNFIVFILILAMGIGFFVAPFVWVAGIVSAVMSANASKQRGLRELERSVTPAT